MPLDLDALERLEKAATPWPWTVESGWLHNRSDSWRREDAPLMAALRNAAPDLIAAARERDKLKARVDELERAMEDARWAEEERP